MWGWGSGWGLGSLGGLGKWLEGGMAEAVMGRECVGLCALGGGQVRAVGVSYPPLLLTTYSECVVKDVIGQAIGAKGIVKTSSGRNLSSEEFVVARVVR